MDFIDELFALFNDHGDRAYGEAVSQRAHALQVAHFAQEDGASAATIAAGLLHDIGQFLDNAGDAADTESRDALHEQHGATYLARHFPEAVVAPVRLHVAAKRYLCAVEPDYRGTLSDASLLSLRFQGGPFDAGEAAAFRKLPFAAEAVRLRRYDDLGKRPEFPVPSLESYRTLLSGLRL